MNTKAILSKINILPDDIFLASYPRSGNTWISLLLTNYVADVDYSRHRFNTSIVTGIHRTPAEELAKLSRPRLIKTHSPFEVALPRVIYIVRDARDVAVSYYYLSLKSHARLGLEKITSFEDYIEQFNLGEVNKYGTWNYHVNSWLSNREKPNNFLLVKYEDLKVNTHETFSKIVKFIWQEVNLERISAAVEATEMSRLQQLEQQQSNVRAPDLAFFRKGIVGDWKNHFTPEMLRAFILTHGIGLRRLGYLPQPDEAVWPGEPEKISIGSLEQQLYQLQVHAYRHWDESIDAKREINQLRTHLSDVRQQLGQCQKQLQRSEQNPQRYDQRLQHSEQKHIDIQSRLDNLSASYVNLEHQLESEQQRASTLEARCHKLKHRLKTSRARTRRYRQELHAVKTSKLWKLLSLWSRIQRRLGSTKS